MGKVVFGPRKKTEKVATKGAIVPAHRGFLIFSVIFRKRLRKKQVAVLIELSIGQKKNVF